MKILFLSQLLPYPPDSGAKVRAYYNLRWLVKSHEVTLVTFTRPDDSSDAVNHLRQYCREVHLVLLQRSHLRNGTALVGSLLQSGSFIIQRDKSSEMNARLNKLATEQHFDAVHTDQLWMTQYAMCVKSRAPGIKLVLDQHNACFQIFERLARGERNPVRRWLWRREAKLLRSYEADICQQFDQVVTVTKEDRNILEGLVHREAGGSSYFTTIPICVDTADVPAIMAQSNYPSILHLGTMVWPPNIEAVLWFGRHVWPLVKEKLPEAMFSVVGKNPPPEIMALGADPRIAVPGYAVDPKPWLEKAGAFVVPLLSGGGMRVKIIDAWRWRLPVISTSIGAEGIDYINGENILIADSPDDFAAAVISVLRDPVLNRHLRINGRRWVETRYDYRVVYPAWDDVYK